MSSDSTAADSLYQSRVDKLIREFKRAIDRNRPLIALGIYRSELVREEVEAELQTQLTQLKQQIEQIQITPKHHDIPKLLVNLPNLENTIFFIKGLQWGGGDDDRNAFRAFNFRREYIIDKNIRLLLWVTESEAQTLAFQATDFWVFRHTAVEFMDTPIYDQVQKHVGRLTWQEWGDGTFEENTDAKIALREELLADLPQTKETQLERAELYYTLAPFYRIKKRYQEALHAGQQALDIADKLKDSSLKWRYLLGRGNTYHDMGQLEDALNDYTQAISLNPQDAVAFYNRGSTYHDMGQLEDALNDYTQAISLNPQDAVTFNNRGNAYNDMGQLKDALNDFTQAIILNPQNAVAFYNRGCTYQDMGQLEDALNDFTQALAINSQYVNAFLNLALVEAKLQQWESVLTCLQQALRLDPNEKSWVAEQEAFKPLHDNKAFRELVGLDEIPQ
ncbi:MAG: tetratricopeptide repeat protein [Chloroflexota bacterium]